MSRKPIPTDVITKVLVSSRRRCCICFGLDRDTRLAAGQIAHLDGNRDNNSIGNLAYLCLVHHDEYDSRTSQRKGLTIDEVKTYRDELISHANRAFTQQVHFGEMKTPPQDPYAGNYVRIDGPSAEITLTPLPDSLEGGQLQYFVSGLALWGEHRPHGPNLGTLEFVGTVTDERRIVHSSAGQGNVHTITLLLEENGAISVHEDNWHLSGEYGMNVNFIGTYRRN